VPTILLRGAPTDHLIRRADRLIWRADHPIAAPILPTAAST
jgi:hypothetical protein